MAIAKCPFKSSYAARPECGAALDGRPQTEGARAQRYYVAISHAYRMHVQTEFLISSAASDLWVCWAGHARPVASTAIETVIESVAARSPCRAWATKELPMKLPRTAGLAVAVSPLAAAVTALAQISGAVSTGPTANVRQAD